MSRFMSLGLAVISCVMALAGCSATQTTDADPAGAAPADFCIDVTVLVNSTATDATNAPAVSADRAPQAAQAHLQQCRYVLFPDGSLRYAPDAENHGAAWLPPLARILNRGQLAGVWSLAQQLGFADPATGDHAINFKTINAQPGEVVYLAGFDGFGKSWSFVRRNPMNQPPDPAMSQLVRRLAQLAWASDEAEVKSDEMPLRYNFGPDPYARYRGK